MNNFNKSSIIPRITIESSIEGCWLGKSIGGTLGLPAEGEMKRLNFSFYDPIPTSAPPNDDLELQLVWLHLVENVQSTELTQSDFAKAWIDHIHYMWDEYGRCRWNLRRGISPKNTGTFENPFHAGMGSPIRSEIWACLFPGDLDSAAHYAALDASLDHGTEGIAGEVLFAVMQSAVISGKGIEEAIAGAVDYLPSGSETARAVEWVCDSHRLNMGAWTCWEELLNKYGNENFTHAPLNVALTIWALLYGEGDFEKSILLAVNAGYDTDCTTATVGATLGLILGPEGIPTRWSEPIGEGVFVGPGILGINAPNTITELTKRTAALIGKLKPKEWTRSTWEQIPTTASLGSLPGTIFLSPQNNHAAVPWANGELPQEVKQAGGARWSWHLSTDEPRQIICLAREGAKLLINGQPVIECPPDLPYVPATHRSPEGSRIQVTPGAGTHEVRLELSTSNPNQEASIILAYPNMHICPWTKEELPNAASLPDWNSP